MASRTLLSPFQQEKLEYYFRFLAGPDVDRLTKHSVDSLMQRALAFTQWPEDSSRAKHFREVHDAFMEILLEKAGKHEGVEEDEDEGMENHEDGVNLFGWLGLWSNLLSGVIGFHQLPLWLRMLPRIIFAVMDRGERGQLSESDFRAFYQDMVHLPSDVATKTASQGYRYMTDCGRYPLRLESYEQLFANFLIGRTPYGPGRYIFGCFEHKVEPFRLIQPLPEAGDDVIMSPRRPSMERRPSRGMVLGAFPLQ